MKSVIKFSRFSICLTTVLIVSLIVGCVLTYNEFGAFLSILLIFLIIVVSGAFYAPLYIYCDKEFVSVKSPLKTRRIPIDQIASVELFQPTMGAIRVFGSGGFMGYWGLFREGDIGKYMAFYGKASDCFLIRMKSGQNYVLGCTNPQAMVDYINQQISNVQS